MMKTWMWIALLSVAQSVAMAGDRARCLPDRDARIYFYPFQQDQPITQKLYALGFRRPGKVIPASNGVVYVADLESARILAIDLRSTHIDVLYHNPNVPEDQYWELGEHENISMGLSLDEKQLYVTDRVEASVYKLDLATRSLTKIAASGLKEPVGVAASSESSILVLDRTSRYEYRLIQINLNDNSASVVLDRTRAIASPVSIDRLSDATFVIASLEDGGGEGWTSFYFESFNPVTATVTPIPRPGIGSHFMHTRFLNQAVFEVSYRYLSEFYLNIADTAAGAWYKDAYIAVNVLEGTDFDRFNQDLEKLRLMANDINADPYDRFSADIGMRKLLQSRACFHVNEMSTYLTTYEHFMEFRRLILDYTAQGALDLVLRLRQAEYDILYGDKGLHTLEKDPKQREVILAAVARLKAAMPVQSTSYGWTYFALTREVANALEELENVEQALRKRLRNW